MARCVYGPTLDDDGSTRLACNVHCAFGRCPHQGQPASQVPMHALASVPREENVAFWRLRTDGQRPLVIHCAAHTGDHDFADTLARRCPCGGEVILPTEVK